MRICIDIDGTICELRKPGQSYSEVKPISGASQKISKLRAAGHTIILLTARHMKSTNGNVGLVLAKQGKDLFLWLENNGFEYDEIHFGKPHADIYIDDNGYRFNGNWSAISDEGTNLPTSHEKVETGWE